MENGSSNRGDFVPKNSFNEGNKTKTSVCNAMVNFVKNFVRSTTDGAIQVEGGTKMEMEIPSLAIDQQPLSENGEIVDPMWSVGSEITEDPIQEFDGPFSPGQQMENENPIDGTLIQIDMSIEEMEKSIKIESSHPAIAENGIENPPSEPFMEGQSRQEFVDDQEILEQCVKIESRKESIDENQGSVQSSEQSIGINWASLDPMILKRIFESTTVCDVYFCRLVCRNWSLAAKEHFKSTTELSWRRLVHRRIDEDVQFRARLCATCLLAGLNFMPNLVKLNFCIGRDVSLVRLSEPRFFQEIIRLRTPNITEVNFSNRHDLVELRRTFHIYAPRVRLSVSYLE